MNETIIYSNKINQMEFIRSLANINIPSFNVRIMNSFSLASEALERSNIIINKDIIQKEDEVFKYIKIIEENKDTHFKSYEDVHHLASTIRNIRLLILNDNETLFLKDKLKDYLNEVNIKLIIDLLDKYLSDNSFIDFVSYLRLAILKAKNTFKEIIYFKEENISPLEKKLINELSNNNVKEISIKEYLKLKDKEISIKDVNPYYGVNNELEEIISKIYKDNLRFDETNIVLTSDGEYLDALYKISVNKKIPMSFNSGVPIIISNVYKLYATLLQLEHTHKFDVNGYRMLFNNEAFLKPDIPNLNVIIEVLGRMKISFNKEDNLIKINNFIAAKNRNVFLYEFYHIKSKEDVDAFIKASTDLINDFSNGLAFVLNKYLNKKDDLDETALSHILDLLNKSDSIKNASIKRTYLDSIDGLLISMSKTTPGYINVISLDYAFSSIKKNNFIVGMNANNFPGKRVEDYLISDDQLLLLNSEAITSVKKIALKNKNFDDLVSLNNSLNNDIYISYSFYNLIECNEINPSSKVFEIVSKSKEENYLNNLKLKTNYFSSDINKIKNIGKAFLNNTPLELDTSSITLPTNTKSLFERKYYPSHIDMFFRCEVEFYACVILGINKESEINRYSVIDSNHFGTLLHYLMQKHYSLPYEDFLIKVEELFNDYLTLNYPYVNVTNDYLEFKKCAINGYNYLQKFTDLQFEVSIEGKHSKLLLGGRYDCLAKLGDEYVLIDFKSDLSIKRHFQDPKSIRQMLLYLKLLNDKGINVKYGEYFYFRYNHIVKANYSTNNIISLLSDLDEFEIKLDTHCFKTVNEEKGCKYCPVASCCIAQKKE